MVATCCNVTRNPENPLVYHFTALTQSGSVHLLLSTLQGLQAVEVCPISHISGEEQDIALYKHTALGTAVLAGEGSITCWALH